MSMTAITASRSASARDIVMVFKPRIAFFIMLSALGGLAASPGELPDAWRITVLMAAVFLAAGAAGAFNQWAESDLDAQMKRTARRPFVTGQFEAGAAWLLAITGLLALSVIMAGMATNWWAATYTFLGAFTYGVVYTIWLKRRTWTNIVIGGLAGSFAVLAGAAGANPQLGPSALVLAVVLFLWTPPHFWSLAMLARDDYAKANVPMLPGLCLGDSRSHVDFDLALALACLFRPRADLSCRRPHWRWHLLLGKPEAGGFSVTRPGFAQLLCLAAALGGADGWVVP